MNPFGLVSIELGKQMLIDEYNVNQAPRYFDSKGEFTLRDREN